MFNTNSRRLKAPPQVQSHKRRIASNGKDGGMGNGQADTPSVTNSILRGDIGGEITGDPTTVSLSDVQGGYNGTGNLNIDPLFVSSADV